MSAFGLTVRGNTDQLILGDDNPALIQRYRGPVVVNRRAGIKYTYLRRVGRVGEENWRATPVSYWWGHGWCDVAYPAPITTQLPPFVFGVPNGALSSGLGAFSHRGGPGNWTGFSVIVTNNMWGGSAAVVDVGYNSWWDYRVCTFGGPPSSDRFGLRLYDSNSVLMFDSGWPLVFWRGLLTSWRALNTGTRAYNMGDYWGNLVSSGDVDQVMQVAAHPWGYQDGATGVLLSSLAGMQVFGDVGNNNALVNFPPMIGFVSGRDEIHCSLMYGLFQHPCAAANSLPQLRFMTADFSKT
jgi:hypothetical protein